MKQTYSSITDYMDCFITEYNNSHGLGNYYGLTSKKHLTTINTKLPAISLVGDYVLIFPNASIRNLLDDIGFCSILRYNRMITIDDSDDETSAPHISCIFEDYESSMQNCRVSIINIWSRNNYITDCVVKINSKRVNCYDFDFDYKILYILPKSVYEFIHFHMKTASKHVEAHGNAISELIKNSIFFNDRLDINHSQRNLVISNENTKITCRWDIF